MATFSTFGNFESIRAEYVPQVGMIRVSTPDAALVFYVRSQRAAQLRDDLSRAIVEAAQASAKAVESEGSPA
jgi:hypothetical protein